MTNYCRKDKILGRQDQSPGREQKEIKPTYRKKFPKLSCEFQLCGWVLRVHSCYHGWKALQLLQSQNQENSFHKNREISFLTMKKKQHKIKKKKKSMTDKPATFFPFQTSCAYLLLMQILLGKLNCTPKSPNFCDEQRNNFSATQFMS
jgi:hypothetical protein